MRRGMEVGYWWRPVIGAAAVAVLLGGCSSVPDALNPVEWYEGTVDLFTGDDEEEQAAAEAQPAPGADKPFPNVGSVPDRPETASPAERQQVAAGLVADREQRRYASSVERQGAPANVLGAAPATPVPETPSAVPVLPVAPAVTASPPRPPRPAPSAPQLAAATPPPPARMSMEPPAMPETGMAKTGAAPTSVTPRATRPVPPANAQLPTVPSSGTLVISSAGVQPGGRGLAEAARETASAPAQRLAFAPALGGTPTSGGLLRVATIQFAIGSASLDARDRAILRQVVALQKERGGIVRIAGHASARTANMDSAKRTLVNYQISLDRAEAIVQALIRLGAPADGIVVNAKSDTEPLYYEFMPSGEAGNRRAEVYLDF